MSNNMLMYLQLSRNLLEANSDQDVDREDLLIEEMDDIWEDLTSQEREEAKLLVKKFAEEHE